MRTVIDASLLEVRDLRTHFNTAEGIVRAVNGVTFSVHEGETLGIVGESGCGKTVTALSIVRLIEEPPGEIAGGQVLFQGRNLLSVGAQEMCEIRGAKIGVIFQDPMTSLNPVLTIGQQIGESLELIQRGTHSLTLVTYSPVLVSMVIFSPS